MDMPEMDMSGMDMGSNLFEGTNMALAVDFWYIVAGFVSLLALFRIINVYKAHVRLRRRAANLVEYPTRPSNRFLELWATLTAIGRETSYPQLYVSIWWLEWLTPPPTGRLLVLLAYWVLIIYMATLDVTIFDGYYWERIGFRNAWITVMQLPLLYLLASKFSVLGVLSRSSYERFNWLHRWVGRTMFITASVHGWHFYQEWAIADFVQLEVEAMPMVKYGLGAWAILLWQLVVSLAPFRRMSYEIFVAQHVISAIVFLWVVYVHVPNYAQYNVWFAIAILCFDRAYRAILIIWQNFQVLPNRSRCRRGQRIGHQTHLRVVGDYITVVTIKDVHFKWQAGQHLYLWMPKIGLIDTHPYTISCVHRERGTCACNTIDLVVRKHNGFSYRLHEFTRRTSAAGKKAIVTAIMSGPYGAPPRWDIHETLVLISASTGASFTLPILESALETSRMSCTRRVDFLLTAKQDEEVEFYTTRLRELADRARGSNLEFHVHIAVTSSRSVTISDHVRGIESPAGFQNSTVPDNHAAEKSTDAADLESKSALRSLSTRHKTLCGPSTDSLMKFSFVRPDIETFIRAPVEAAGGETCVVVCGGSSLVSCVRNCVVRLADERAVHKGTGAQGIQLHVEEYCF